MKEGEKSAYGQTLVALIALVGIVLHLTTRYLFAVSAEWNRWPLYAVFIFGGAPLVLNLTRRLMAGQFSSDILAGVAIITSVFLDEFLAGAIVILMLSGGTALEEYAIHKARDVLGSLSKRMPNAAHKRSEDGLIEVSLAELALGDEIIVLPHENCPVDGTVVEGHGTMDESYLTGEPFQISKVAGASVLSGAINGETALTIRVDKLPVDSRYAHIMRVMEDAEKNRPPMRRIADRLGAWYTPFAILVAVSAWVIAGDPSRFLSVLVIATPCPLLLAIPIAITGAISLAARQGIIIKNPAMLEKIDLCRTFIFDKTGTLTYGRPELTEVLPADGVDPQSALRLAASLEQFSKHPLSAPLLDAVAKRGIPLGLVHEVSEKPGQGLQGIVEGKNVSLVGRSSLSRFESLLPPQAAGLECVLLMDGQYAATFRFRDEPRQESAAFIKHLGPKHAVAKVILLSGDRESEAKYLGSKVGIDNVFYEKSPEEKVTIVRDEAARALTLFVGDGINDAPAMQVATVGIAFGHGNAITSEAADAVVLDASLGRVDEVIHIGRRMRRIALQSALGGMGLSMVGVLFAALGFLPPLVGAVLQEGIDVLAVINALRVMIYKGKLREIA